MNKLIQVKNSTVNYQLIKSKVESDKNIPIVFLHGTNSDGNSSYGKIVETHFSNRDVVLIDYGGCGQSTLPSDDVDLSYLAEQVVGVILDLELANFDLVGHSLGAVVSVVVAARTDNRVQKLVLSAPWRESSDPRHKLFFELWQSLEKYDSRSALSFGLTHAFSPEFLSKLGTDTIDNILSMDSTPDACKRIAIGMNANIEPFVSKITCPCLIIGLSKDTLIPVYMVKQVVEGIKNSIYHEISSGHAVQIENPSDWSVKIVNFLGEKNKINR